MVGNDVVDLSDPESSHDARHARFDRRVFTHEEFEALSSDHTDTQWRWILWSAKEAAFKAARREAVEAVFSPARFVVILDRSLCGSVGIGSRRWPVRIQIAGNCVHAVVSENESFAGILSGSRRLTVAELLAGDAEPVALSLSHHGSYAGFACCDPRIEIARRTPQRVAAAETSPPARASSHRGSRSGFAVRFDAQQRVFP
jgi:hypothetical protein